MAALSPSQCLLRLRQVYRDSTGCTPHSDAVVLTWASAPELWATQKIRTGWSFEACESVVRACRILRKRARQSYDAGLCQLCGDAFDPLIPTADRLTDHDGPA